MKLTTEKFNQIRRSLLLLLRKEEFDEIFSHIWSLERENEDLKKSRDSWKLKYLKLKEEVKS